MNTLEGKIDRILEDVGAMKLELGVLIGTVREINQTVNGFAVSTKREFDSVREEVEDLKGELLTKSASREKVEEMDGRLKKLESRVV